MRVGTTIDLYKLNLMAKDRFSEILFNFFFNGEYRKRFATCNFNMMVPFQDFTDYNCKVSLAFYFQNR